MRHYRDHEYGRMLKGLRLGKHTWEDKDTLNTRYIGMSNTSLHIQAELS